MMGRAPEDVGGIAVTNPLIGPAPAYPTPWRVAETRDNHTVVACSEGHYAANCPTPEIADLIVRVVNEAAERGVVE